MNPKTVNSMRNLCRTCMTRFSKAQRESAINNKQSIHEVPTGCKEDASLMELLQLVQPQIKVEISDNLPTLMCTDCIKKLLMTHEFIEMYKNVDKQFRNMLKQVETTNSRRNVKASKESIEIIEVNDQTEEAIEKEDDIYELTKYELEVEEINIEELDKEEVNVSDWPEFDDEPLHDISEEAEDKEYFTNPYSDEESEEKELYFTNPYSDASDNEWTPNESCQKGTITKSITKKRKSDNDINDDTTIDIPSKKKPKKRISNRRDKIQLSLENNDGSFKCQECETVFDNEQLRLEHMRFHRMGKMCKRKYTKKSDKPSTNQIDHMGYECNLCSKVFSKNTSYKIHMRVHTGEAPYLCIECGKGFKVLGSLNTHMLRHKGEKNVQCPHCPKKFVCSSGLYGHMMVHTKEKPFVCDICGAAFHMAYMLRKHNLYHNGIKNYPCEYCDMRFVTAEKCRRHMRTHTGEKPYRCKYCERAFAQSNDCIKHLRQHLGDNVYQCELCPLRFPLARDLRVHFATHKDDDEETRARYLQARLEEEQNLRDKLGVKET